MSADFGLWIVTPLALSAPSTRRKKEEILVIIKESI